MVQRVLVPLDGTGFSEAALAFLESRHEKGGDLEVLLVGVWEPTEEVVGGDPVRRVLAPQVLHCVESNLQSYLSRAQARLKGSGIATRSLFLLGNPVKDMAALAQREGADLVITGPRGAQGPRCTRPSAPWCQGPCPIPV